MARINIEDSIFKDVRFNDLCIKTQSIDAALGGLVRAWSLAQTWYLSDDRMIPVSEWKKQRINDQIIEVGLAEIIGDKIKVDGSDEQFSWLIHRQQAGKKGGLSKSEKASNAIKQETTMTGDNESKREVAGASGSKPLTLSHTLNSDSNSNNELNTLPEPKTKKLKNPQDAEHNKQIWDAYFNAYRLRYGIEAVRNATVNAQVSNLRKKLGVDDATKVVEFYLRHNDSFYLKNTHSFGLCLRDGETLRTQMLKGKAITGRDVRSFENQLGMHEMHEEIKKGGF